MAEEDRVARQMMGRLSGFLSRAPTEYESQLQKERVRHLPLLSTEHFSKTFQKCSNEFASAFYAFVLSETKSDVEPEVSV
jgi:hypothetical protein